MRTIVFPVVFLLLGCSQKPPPEDQRGTATPSVPVTKSDTQNSKSSERAPTANPAAPAKAPKTGAEPRGEQPFGRQFAGRSTASLEVLRSVRLRKPGGLDSSTLKALFEIIPRPIHEGDASRLLAATDNKTFTRYTCTVKADGSTVEIVVAHFGDTLVGVVLQNGRFVARVEDSELRPPS